MAAYLQVSYTFLLFYINILTVFGQSTSQTPSTTVQPNTDVGPCTCDLTINVCDVNCCCDSSCSADDRATFAQCDDTALAYNSQYCIRKAIIFQVNTPYTVDISDPGLFCIITDNYKDRNYFYAPEPVNDTDKFNIYMNQYKSQSTFAASATSSGLSEKKGIFSNYKSGEVIYTIFQGSNIIGNLGLPRSLPTTSRCDDGNTAVYLRDDVYTCVRELSSLDKTSCEETNSFKAGTFYEGFKIISTPTVLSPRLYNVSNPETWVNVPLYNQSGNVEIKPILPAKCIVKDGVVEDCSVTNSVPIPVYDDTTKICSNVVTKVDYEISVNSTTGIDSVEVRFTLSSIKDTNLPLTQTYTTTFTRPPVDNKPVFRTSGNPGYMVGEPVLAGKLVTTKDKDGNDKLSIGLNSNRNRWLTIINPGLSGDCVKNLAERESVKFGVNMRSGCIIQLSLSNISNVCQVLQELINSALLADAPTYIATFGNTPVDKVGDWLEIIKDENPKGGSVSRGSCNNIVLGLQIQIIYANVGSLGNPQPKIVGAKYAWDASQTIQFQCFGVYCQPGMASQPQNFELVSSVSFVDMSRSAISLEAEIPLFTVRLPYDFFYPFIAEFSSSISLRSHLQSLPIAITSIVAIVYMYL